MKTNFIVQKSYAFLCAIGFVLFFLSSGLQTVTAQSSSPLPQLVSVDAAITIVTAELDILEKKSNGDPNLLTPAETERAKILHFVLNELQTNQYSTGYQTMYALHLVATDDIFKQLQQTQSTIEVNPFAWITQKYKTDANYKYVVEKLKI